MAGAIAYEISDYSLDALVNVLARCSQASEAEVRTKTHLGYFDGYFTYLGAQTMLVESDYIDRDFLEDYAGYYARCFVDYPRRCTRLHFFNRSFSVRTLRRALEGSCSPGLHRSLQAAYLGFVVVKPLPATVIGRTCLRTYSDDPARAFPAVRSYDVNLFGLDLTVETLAFQEQDTAAAACATSALWSAFQKTGLLFQHPIPSPVTITQAGTARLNTRDRVFPNRGLSIEQMADAIRSTSLEPYVVDVGSEEVLKATAYGYLGAGIPSMLLLRLFKADGRGGYSPRGYHAVTVGGYHLATAAPSGYSSISDVPLIAARIDKLYANDDQVGPFARMEFDGLSVIETSATPNVTHPLSLSTGWLSPLGPDRAVPLALLVPLYNKIRIPFSVVHDSVVPFHHFLAAVPVAPPNLEWDIRLTTVSQLKRELRADPAISPMDRRRLLLRAWPRFLWRATLHGTGQRLFDFLYDATDLEQGQFLMEVVEHDQQLGANLRAYAHALSQVQPELTTQFGRTIQWFLR